MFGTGFWRAVRRFELANGFPFLVFKTSALILSANRPSLMVEDAGFEPAAFCVQSSCASKLRQSPMFSCFNHFGCVQARAHRAPCGCSRCTQASCAHPAQPFPWLRKSGVQGHTRSGAGGGDRTRDFRVGNALLYRLRYACMVRTTPAASAAGCSH
jgi:hypothetical protein